MPMNSKTNRVINFATSSKFKEKETLKISIDIDEDKVKLWLPDAMNINVEEFQELIEDLGQLASEAVKALKNNKVEKKPDEK